MIPLAFTGPQERKLARIATAPDYVFSGGAALGEHLEACCRVWLDATSDTEWEGLTADAADVAFRRGAMDAIEHLELIGASLRLVDEANEVLTQARHDYAALPQAHIPTDIVTRAIAGAPAIVPGFGLVATPVAVRALAMFLFVRREQDAQRAVIAFTTRMDALATRMAAVNSSARIPAAATPLSSTGGQAAAKPSLDDILSDYQVSDDPDGMTTWPGPPASWLVDPEPMTAAEARILDNYLWSDGIRGIILLRDMKDDAFSKALERFPPTVSTGANDDHTDAFRHAYWNALMAARVDPEWAEQFATAHEGSPHNLASAREAMDLYNNEVGRHIATQNPEASDEELAELVEQAVRDGEMVVIGPNGQLAWSNQIPEGGTGHPGDGPTLPGQRHWNNVVAGEIVAGDES